MRSWPHDTLFTSPLFFTNNNRAIETKNVLNVFGKSCFLLIFRVGPTSIYTNLVFLTMLQDTSTIPIHTLLLLKKDLFGGYHFLCSKVNIWTSPLLIILNSPNDLMVYYVINISLVFLKWAKINSSHFLGWVWCVAVGLVLRIRMQEDNKSPHPTCLHPLLINIYTLNHQSCCEWG